MSSHFHVQHYPWNWMNRPTRCTVNYTKRQRAGNDLVFKLHVAVIWGIFEEIRGTIGGIFAMIVKFAVNAL